MLVVTLASFIGLFAYQMAPSSISRILFPKVIVQKHCLIDYLFCFDSNLSLISRNQKFRFWNVNFLNFAKYFDLKCRLT